MFLCIWQVKNRKYYLNIIKFVLIFLHLVKEIIIISSLTLPRVIQTCLTFFPSSVKHKRRYFEKCLTCFCPYYEKSQTGLNDTRESK